MKELLKNFCSIDTTRLVLNSLINQDDFTYATDGKICVRVKKLSDIADIDTMPTPDFKSIFKDINFSDLPNLIRIPETLPELTYRNCDCCKGEGKISTCPECDGEGMVELENDYNEYECECKTCNGSGKIKGDGICEECNGKGKLFDYKKSFIELSGVRLPIIYLNKLKLLKNPLLSIDESKPCRLVPFIFDGGEGILMPIAKE
jgi:hypothetical protein